MVIQQQPPMMGIGCLYQVRVGPYIGYKCLQTEEQYQQWVSNQPSIVTIILSVILLVTVLLMGTYYLIKNII